MKAIIIDDNQKATNELKQMLAKYPDIQVLDSALNSFDGLSLLEKYHPDVVFLDVMMPNVSGLEFLDRVPWLQSKNCRIVMYTSYDKFILPAMRKKAFDVLLKPIDPTELDTVMQRLREPVDNKQGDVPDNGKTNPDMILLWINASDFKLVNKSDVGLFQYNTITRCWEALLVGQKKPLTMKRSIKADTLLDLDPQFVQINQKFVININFLIEVVDNKCHFFPPFDKVDNVTVSRLYRKQLTDRFFNL